MATKISATYAESLRKKLRAVVRGDFRHLLKNKTKVNKDYPLCVRMSQKWSLTSNQKHYILCF